MIQFKEPTDKETNALLDRIVDELLMVDAANEDFKLRTGKVLPRDGMIGDLTAKDADFVAAELESRGFLTAIGTDRDERGRPVESKNWKIVYFAEKTASDDERLGT